MSDDQPTDVVAALSSDGAYTLFVADFADTDTALAVRGAQVDRGRRTLEIDGVLVVTRAPTARSRSRRRPTTAPGTA